MKSVVEWNLNQFTEQRSPSDDEFEGTLVRKHVWETMTKKASSRSWEKLYMVVRGQNLIAYKDQKSYKSTPDQPFKGEASLDLRGGTIIVASDYTKKKHVFRVKYVQNSRTIWITEQSSLFPDEKKKLKKKKKKT